MPSSNQIPSPFIIAPSSGTHTQTIIILHGRGSNGTKFGVELLDTPIRTFGSLQSAFPNAKFIFPTAPLSRAQIYNRCKIHQWFDNWSLVPDPTAREELQLEGLRGSAVFINDLVKSEVATVGKGNVVLWGMSQGCAATLVSTLLYRWEGLGAVVGMCGWLPLRERMQNMVAEEEDDGVFERSEGLEEGKGKVEMVVEYLREELQMSNVAKSADLGLNIPIFLGHGKEDERVPVEMGWEAVRLLRSLGGDVQWRDYKGLGHWFSGEMLRDVVEFIQQSAGWEAVAVDDVMPASELENES